MNNPRVQDNAKLTRIAIACQGGGSHAAYVAGALRPLLQQFEDQSPLQLVALSGTSGGAICALVAWWGLLTGGPERAIERLESFWDHNSALCPGETLLNATGIGALEAMPCEMQWSPYRAPLRLMLDFNTLVWPRIAKRFGNWIRPDYFRMDVSLAGQLAERGEPDFARTVAAIGVLGSMPAEVQAWSADALDEALGGLAGGEVAAPAAQRFKSLFAEISAAAADLGDAAAQLPESAWLRRAMDEYRRSAQAEIARLGNHQLPQTYNEGEGLMLDLDRALAPFLRLLPRLIVGAVDVGSGEFQTFRSDRKQISEGVSIQAILASAAIPYLFQAVGIEDEDGRKRWYWDGLFSENPPIKAFTSPSGETPSAGDCKPDEIWIAQVNPRRCEVDGGSRRHSESAAQFDIFDRRNELSGNLSLFQEMDFIDVINRQIDKGADEPLDKHQHIQVFTIPLDNLAAQRESGRRLGFASKIDRDRGLKNALLKHGREQAGKFLPVRDFIVGFVNQRSPARRTVYAGAAPAGLQALLADIEQLHRKFNDYFRVFVEEIAIGGHPSCACRRGKNWDVTLHWRAWGATTLPGQQFRAGLTGRIHLDLADGALQDGCLDSVRIVEKKPSVTASPGRSSRGATLMAGAAESRPDA